MMLTNKEIFLRALTKAMENGFSLDTVKIEGYTYQGADTDWAQLPLFSVIFSHDFAKAFFQDSWKERLQEMVLEENPLKYLEGFIYE